MPDRAEWQLAEVTSPHLSRPVPVVAAKGIPYIPSANRLQNLSIYLPRTPETSRLAGTPVEGLPDAGAQSPLARYHVHVHGGAWRDPELTAASVESAVAHAFSGTGPSAPISAVASINYTVTQFSYAPPPTMAHLPPLTTPSGTTTPTRPVRRSTRSTSATFCTAWPCSAPTA